MEKLEEVLNFFRQRKRFILFAFVCYVVFSILIFPYGDLSDLVTEKVAEQTNNQVHLSFDDLGLALLPPGVNLKEVLVDTSFAPQLKMQSLSLAPSIAGLLAFKPGFVAQAEGLFGGDMDLTYKTGEKTEDELNMQQIDLELSGTQIKPLASLANLPLEVRGVGEIEITGNIDPGFREQPESVYNVQLKNVSIPAGTVPTPLGPLNIPTVEFQSVNLQGQLVNGELLIEKGQLGQTGDDIQGTITGRIAIRFNRAGNQVIPTLGAYDLRINMTLTRSAERNFSLFLTFIDDYKQITGSGFNYPLRVRGTSFRAPPRLERLPN